MSLARRAKKRDTTERPIIAALTDLGAQVFQLDRPCDLAVYWRGRWWMLEVKSPGKHLTPAQERDHALLPPGAIPVVLTVEDALEALGYDR